MPRLGPVRNHVVVLLRNFRREKLYTAINITGLALGLASCLLLGLFLRSELTYDQHYPNHRNIYRVANEFTINGKPEPMVMSADALGPMLKDEYPAMVLGSVRIRPFGNGGTAMRRPEQPEKVFYWENSYFADDNIFEVFPVEVLYGDPKTALVKGTGVAISQSVAKKYFGDENPIGKLLVTDSSIQSIVTLVFRDQPANTHLRYDLLFSYNLPFLRIGDTPTQRRQRLVAINGFTYLVMHPAFRPADWQRMSHDFTVKYMGEDLRAAKIQWRSWLQPLAGTHMQAEAGYDRPNGNAAYLHGCAAVALIILIVACINYMNPARDRAARRARSVAWRKILGASRLSLAAQFMAEALLFAMAASVLAVALVEVALKFTPLAGLFDNKVTLDLLREPVLGLWLAGVAAGVGLLSGLYPALYLSSWAPLTALTGTQQARGNLRMRELLVLVQFTISVAAITCTLLMMAQMHYVATRPLGFAREHRLLVWLRGATTIDKIPAIRNELLGDAGIRGVAVAQNTPADGNDKVDMRLLQIEGEDGVMGQQMLNIQPLGQDYEKVMGLTITQGRDLSSRPPGEVGPNVLVNEALVRKMGWTNAIGKRIQVWQGEGRVVGVVRDFNFKTLHHRIDPLVMVSLGNDMSRVSAIERPFQQRQLILDIAPAQVHRALEVAGRVMARADPQHPFEYRFLDASLEKLYETEHSLTRLIGIFAGISIFIACLGLFGLAAFTTEQRAREIGTRKVLGATAWQIVGLLARRVLVLALVAAVLAGVVAYFAVEEWLQGFAYKAGINPLVFLLAAAVAVAVAFATVAAQSWRVANADPVRALRYM
jgi:putative ABC transport system permease protein